MSKIEELIEELCPNGVERHKLNTVCKIYDGTHQTPNYIDAGIPFVSVENIGNIYESKKFISAEDYEKYKIKPQIGDVFMTRIGSIGKCAVFEKEMDLAYYVSLALLRPNRSMVNSRYLKHLIESTIGAKELRKRTLVNAVPIKVNKDDIGKITIPVPPLQVQSEIVRILDNFTELTARKKQYEYYRNNLLREDAPLKSLKKISNGISSGKCKERLEDGAFPLYGSTGIISSTNTASFHKKQILIARVGANAGYVHIADGDYDVSDNTLILDLKSEVSLEYIYYQLTNMNLHRFAKGGGQPLVTAGQLKDIEIPIPSEKRQEEIVDLLNRFYFLCTDVSEGLPAEIEARQKQYEYYRDKLLTFKELEG